MALTYLPTCLKQKAGQNPWKSGIFGLKAGHKKEKKNPDVYFSFFCDQTLDKLNLSPSYVWITIRGGKTQ